MNSPAIPVIDIVQASLRRRYARERRFRRAGVCAVALGLFFVSVLFLDIFLKGYSAFQQTYVQLSIRYDAAIIDPEGCAATSARTRKERGLDRRRVHAVQEGPDLACKEAHFHRIDDR